MDAKTVEAQYLKITIRCAKCCGVWPYQSSGAKYFIRFVLIAFVIITLVIQIAKLVISGGSEALADQCPFLCVTFGSMMKMFHHIVNEGRFKVILADIVDDWKTNGLKAEYDIMNMYGERAVFITTIYLVNGIISSMTFVQIPLIPLILDIISPLNVSRGIGYMFPAYYFVDEHRYYYLIIAHMIFAVSFVLIFNVACDSTYMYIVQHACGLLAVSGYRFRNAIQATVIQKQKDVDNETYRNVRYSIQAHKRAIKYMNDVENIYATAILLGMILVIGSLSITLLKVSKMNYCMDYLKYLAFFSVQLVHLLVLTIQGQFVTNAGNDIYDAICESFWYNGPCRTQALYILVLRRSLVPPQFTVGRIIPMNLRTFAEIVKVSVSYFMVLQST